MGPLEPAIFQLASLLIRPFLHGSLALPGHGQT